MDCTIDETSDQRRKQVLKRKLDSLDEKGRLLDRLVSTIRESDKMSAVQIVNLIRGHATLEELRVFIDDMLERSRLDKTPDVVEVCNDLQRLHESERRSIRHRPNANQVSDIVLFRVPAFPWTTVTEDNDFVSHLLSLWFTWTHPFLNWIDRDLFIREMQSKDLDATFCSPFLVNIMLADACVSPVGNLTNPISCIVCRHIPNTPKLTLSRMSNGPGGCTFIKKPNVTWNRWREGSLSLIPKGWALCMSGKFII